MKRSIFVREQLEWKLAQSGLIQIDSENYSGAINTVLDRYFAMVRRARPVFNQGEWEAIKDAFGWDSENGATERSTPFLSDPRQLPLLFEDYLIAMDSRDCGNQDFIRLKQKCRDDWDAPFNGVALLEKLRGMSYPEWVSILDAIEAEHNLQRKILADLKKTGHLQIDPFAGPIWSYVVGTESCQADISLDLSVDLVDDGTNSTTTPEH